MSDSRVRSPASRLLSKALILLVVLVVALSVLRLTRSFPRDAHLGYTEGTWLALAIDTAQGVFYRPLEGPLGYGGIRYFPLFFTVHATAIRLGAGPLAAGYVLAIGAVGLLCAGIVLFLRRLGSGSIVACAAAAVALASQPTQLALLTIRGDGLPAALTVLGLAVCIGPTVAWAAPVLFVLAFAAKPTSIYGLAAAVLVLLLTDRRREASRLTLAAGAGIACVLVAMWVASEHRVFDILAASASGGAGWTTIALAPMSFARILRRTPEVLVLLGLALAAGWTRPVTPTLRNRLEVVAGIMCLGVTLAIYASPATVENHLIDLVAMAVLVIGAMSARQPATRQAPVMLVLLVAGAMALSTATYRFMTEDGRDMRQTRLAALTAIADAPRPVFFEQPMLAAERGESSYFLDPYIVMVRARSDAVVLQRFLDDIDRRVFGAIVLEQASSDLWFTDLPPRSARAVREAITRHYTLQGVVEGRAIYRPK